MSHQKQKQQENQTKGISFSLGFAVLHDVFTDFVLSRQALLCSPATLRWYSWTLGKFLQFMEANGVTRPDEITARHVRAYLSMLAEKGSADTYVHNHARAIRTFLKFLAAENYAPSVTFKMPSLSRKQLPMLDARQVQGLLAAIRDPRELALVMAMIDTGVRRAEVLALNWGDVEIENGMVRIARGKGGKSRVVVVGVNTRRALLKYRRSVLHAADAPLFQTRSGKRYSANGLRGALLRIGREAGIRLSPHMLRRTFATLSLRAGMNPLHLQGLLGHSTLEMTKQYVGMIDADLLAAHRQHGPIDNL